MENYSFSDLITFTRTTNATLVDGTGRVTYAPNNLFTNSEAFDASSWTKANATVGANATSAPNSTTTADAIIENTATSTHGVNAAVSVTIGVSYVLSVYAKQNGRSLLRVGSADSQKYGVFDLIAGVVQYVDAGVSASITSVGDGWYRCAVTERSTVTGTGTYLFRMQSNTSEWPGTGQYTGNGVSGVFLWGAQVEAVTYQTTAGTYNSTSPPNLLGFTEEFDNAAWSKTRATITANVTLAPNGTMTADKLNDDGLIVGRSYVSQNYTYTNVTHTLSFYAKAGEATSVNCYLVDSVGIVVASDATINLTNGQVTAGSAIVTNAGNGWYRIAVSGVPTAGAGSVRILLATDTATTNGLFIWGAQLSNSASVDPYVYNPGAAPTSTAYYGPRFDYNPATLAPLGLLIEEQRVNLLLYSDQFDNAAWTKAGSTITANATTSPDGTVNADKLVENTALAQHRVQQAVTTVIGTSYTHTIYLKAGERTTATLRVIGATTFAGCTINLTAGTISGVTGVGTITNAGNGWYRVSVTGTADSTTSTCFVNLADAGNNTYTGDGVSGAFFYGAQLEAGAFATSYIPTVASTVTRAADIAVMSGSNLSSWYNQSQGTIVVSADSSRGGVGGAARTFVFNNGTSSNNIRNGGQSTLQVLDAGVAQVSIAGVPLIPFDGTVFKFASAYKENDFATVTTGAVTTDTSGTVPTVNQLLLGSGETSTTYLNGHIRSITYYPYRLADFQLQALTA